MATHEQFDGKGFPAGIQASLIPRESQLIQYSELVDQKLLIKMGTKNNSSSVIQKGILEDELDSRKILDLTITLELKKSGKDPRFFGRG